MEEKEVAGRSQEVVSIGNKDLKFAEYRVPKDEATGKEVLLAYGAEELDEYVVLQWFHGGTTVRLGVNEDAKPDEEAANRRFLVFEGKAVFEFELDGNAFQWGGDQITGKVLKLLVGLDPSTYAVWREREKGEDDEIENEESSRLDDGGSVVYFTGRQETTEGGRTV